MLMRRHLETLGLDIPDKKINFFVLDDFFRSPNTKLIKRFDFTHDHKAMTLVHWKLPLIKVSRLLGYSNKDWLSECSATTDSVAYSYLINWLAHTIQYPETKPEVILINGAEGTEKAHYLGFNMMIFGDVVFSADKAEQLVGRFQWSIKRQVWFVWLIVRYSWRVTRSTEIR